MAGTVKFANPIDGADGGDVEAGEARVQEQLENSVVALVEHRVGKVTLDTSATTLAKGGGFGRPGAQALLMINWAQNFALVALLELMWPPWWRSLVEWLPFPFKLVFPVEFILPWFVIGDNTKYIAVLCVQPVLCVYTWYRASFFNECSVFKSLVPWTANMFIDFTGSKAGLVHPCFQTEPYVSWAIWLSVWIGMPLLLTMIAFLASIDGSDEVGSGSFDDRRLTSVQAEEQAESARVLRTLWLGFFSFVPFLIGYNVAIRSSYITSQNRNEPEKVFFGRWAIKEAQVLVFLVMTTHLSAPAACLQRYNASTSFGAASLHMCLAIVYGTFPPAILAYFMKEMHDKLHGGEEERDDAMDRIIREAEQKGDLDSFKAGLYATIKTFERKYWFFKPYMMLEKLPLAFFVLGMAREEVDDATGSSTSVDEHPIQIRGSVAVVGVATLVFIVARPFSERAEDFTEGMSRLSNLLVLCIGVLIDSMRLKSTTGDWMLVAVSVMTVITFVISIGPLRAFSELRAFYTQRAAASQAARFGLDEIKKMPPSSLAHISADVFQNMSCQQQAWMLFYQGEHLEKEVVPAELNLIGSTTDGFAEYDNFNRIFEVQPHVRTLCGLVEGQTEADFRGQIVGPIAGRIMAAEFDSRGFIDTVVSMNCLDNEFGEEGLVTLLTAIEGTSVRSICGLTEGQTTAMFSGQNLGPIDCKIIAAEYNFCGFIDTVEELAIRGTPITSAGGAILLEAIKSSKLKTIDIGTPLPLQEPYKSHTLDVSRAEMSAGQVLILSWWLTTDSGIAVEDVNIAFNQIEVDGSTALLDALKTSSVKFIGIGKMFTATDGATLTTSQLTAGVALSVEGRTGELVKAPDGCNTVELKWDDDGRQERMHLHTLNGIPLKLPLQSPFEGESLDLSYAQLDPGHIQFLSWWLTTKSSATVNVLTVDSTGDMNNQKTYTLTAGEGKIELYQKNLGSLDVALLAAWLHRSEVIATVTSMNCLANKFGDEDLATLLVAIQDTSIGSLCGLTEGQTTANFSKANAFTPIDCKIVAAEYGFRGFISTVNSLTMVSTSKHTRDKLSYTLTTGAENIDLSVQDDWDLRRLGSADLALVAAWLQQPKNSANLKVLTMISTGDTRGPQRTRTAQNTYTLAAGEQFLDLSNKSLGAADATVVAAWLASDAAVAVVNLDIANNPIGAEGGTALIEAIESSANLSTIDIGVPLPLQKPYESESIVLGQSGISPGHVMILSWWMTTNFSAKVKYLDCKQSFWGADTHTGAFKHLAASLKTSCVTGANFDCCYPGKPFGLVAMSHLSDWIRVETLSLRQNKIQDVGPLASLTGLTDLDLSFNNIRDVSPLASLTGLTCLDLSFNNVHDVSPLASLTKLTLKTKGNYNLLSPTKILRSFEKNGVHHYEVEWEGYADTSEELCSQVHEDRRFDSLVSDFRSC